MSFKGTLTFGIGTSGLMIYLIAYQLISQQTYQHPKTKTNKLLTQELNGDRKLEERGGEIESGKKFSTNKNEMKDIMISTSRDIHNITNNTSIKQTINSNYNNFTFPLGLSLRRPPAEHMTKLSSNRSNIGNMRRTTKRFTRQILNEKNKTTVKSEERNGIRLRHYFAKTKLKHHHINNLSLNVNKVRESESVYNKLNNKLGGEVIKEEIHGMDGVICYRTEDVLVVVALTCALNFTFVFLIWAIVRSFSGQRGKLKPKKLLCPSCKNYSKHQLNRHHHLPLLCDEKSNWSSSSSDSEEEEYLKSEEEDNLYRKMYKKFNSMEDLRYLYT